VESDRIDPAVGLSDVLGVGDPVAKGQPLARIHAARTEQAAEALKAVLAAITIGDRPAEQRLVVERITA
jgi:thymidine phosphorylase